MKELASESGLLLDQQQQQRKGLSEFALGNGVIFAFSVAFMVLAFTKRQPEHGCCLQSEMTTTGNLLLIIIQSASISNARALSGSK